MPKFAPAPPPFASATISRSDSKDSFKSVRSNSFDSFKSAKSDSFSDIPPELIHSANSVQLQVIESIQTPKISSLNFEECLDCLEPLFYASRSQRPNLNEVREQALRDFAVQCMKATPTNADRLGGFLAAKSAVAGRLPNGEQFGKPMAWKQFSDSVKVALTQQASITFHSLPSISSLRRAVVMAFQQKSASLAYSFDWKAGDFEASLSPGSSSTVKKSLISFEARNYDVSDSRTAALLITAAMPLDVLASGDVNPKNWAVTAQHKPTQCRVQLDRATLWKIATNPDEAEKYSQLSVQVSEPTDRPLQELYGSHVALPKKDPIVQRFHGNLESIVQGSSVLAMTSVRGSFQRALSSCVDGVKSLWHALSDSAREARQKDVSAPLAVDMSSRRSRRQAVESLVQSIRNQVSTHNCLDQLFELKRLISGFDLQGNKVAEDLGVHYSGDWRVMLNLKGYGNKANLIDSAHSLLEKHEQGLIKIACSEGNAVIQTHPVSVRAKAAFTVLPAAVLNQRYLRQFGFEDKHGIIETPQQLFDLVNPSAADDGLFKANAGFKRLSASRQTNKPADPDAQIDPFVLLDAYVDYRNSETGEKNTKDYRLWQKVLSNESFTVRLGGQVGSSRVLSLDADRGMSGIPENFEANIQRQVDTVFSLSKGPEYSRQIKVLMDQISIHAYKLKMPPERLFDSLRIKMPRHPGQVGPGEQQVISYQDFLNLVLNRGHSDEDAANQ